MEYNGVEFELPKKTLSLNSKIEAVNNAKSTDEAYRKMWDFVTTALGKEKAQEVLQAKTVNDVDLIQLNVLCNRIVRAYDDAVSRDIMEYAESVLSSNIIDKIIEASKVQIKK